MRQIVFNNHVGEELAGTLDEPSDFNGKGVVLGHCFTCSRHTRILSDLSQVLAGIGYIVLRFDFSGNGQSDGDFRESTYSKQIRELQCAMEYIKDKGARDIILAGHSMGGTVALLTAAQADGISAVIGLAVGSTLMYPDRLLTEPQKAELGEKGETAFSSRGRELTITREFFDDAGRFDLVRAVADIRCPILLIYGGQDTIITPDSSRILSAPNPSNTELITIKNADHMFTADEDRRTAIYYVIQWVRRL